MTRQGRSIAAVFTLAVLAIGGTAAAAQAHGGTLLSGYGTSGEGNQALLGSALLGGGSKGGGAGSGGSGGSGGGRGVAQPVGSQGAGVQATGSNGASTDTGSGAVRTTRHAAAPSKQSVRTASPQAPSRAGGAIAGTSGGSHKLRAASASQNAVAVPLGVTETDLLYILLGVGGLMLTVIFTRQLVHPPH